MTDVFSDPKPEKPAEASSENQTSGSDPLSSLVGEDKKFKTVEDLAKSKIEADNFIEQLKQEQKELRKELERASAEASVTKTVEELMQKQGGKSDDNQSPRLTPDEISKLVDERLKTDRERQNRAANRESANAMVLEHFHGDEAKARDFVKAEAKRLGMDVTKLGEISADSPAAFLRLVGINQPKANPGTDIPTVVNPDAGGGDSTVRDNKYWQQKRRELGHRFFEPAIQQQRMKDRQALGDRFYQ